MSHDRIQRLMVELTTKCNLKCIHCFHGSRENSLDPEQLGQQAVSTAKELDIPHIVFTGGEPFIIGAEMIVSAVAAATANGRRTHVVTNGTLCVERDLQQLKSVGLETLLVSIDGATPCCHDGIRGKPGTLDLCKQTVLAARRIGLPVRALFNVMRRNKEEVSLVIGMCRDLGIATLALFRCTPRTWEPDLADDYLSDTEWAQLLTTSVDSEMRSDQDMRVLYEPTMITRPEIAKKIDRTGYMASCLAKRREEVYLASDGIFYACQLALVPSLQLGTRAVELIDGKAWAFLDNQSPTGCAGCEYIGICRGGCRTLAFRAFGDFNACDPRCLQSSRRIRLCPQCFTPPWTQLNSRQYQLFLPSSLMGNEEDR